MPSRNAYKNEWISKTYDRINLTVPKGQKEVVQNHAKAHGESVNGFINRAVNETMDRDNAAQRGAESGTEGVKGNA